MQKTFNFFYAFLLAILGFGATLMAEDITLTTYYPAPYGAYDELTTTGDTYLATTSGNVGIGTTAPGAYKLDVIGTINATAFSAGATIGAAGTTTITYVKTVNFVAQTVTTGTITVKDGIVTVIN
ncbi:MAG TPA: hypothetical protein DCY56_02375 [Candidatus Omnitrophica bacterium]|nr:hypothetical protein [Candidatus Omnitrophota bacterium]